MRRSAVILGGELRSMIREPELSFLLLAPFLIGLILRLALTHLSALLADKLGFDLGQHLPFLMGYMMLVPALLCGMVVGLRLIDDRDAGVLDYIAVTPLSTGGYLAVRLLIPGLLSIPLSAMLPYLEGSFRPPPGPILLIASIGALNAPLLTLFLAAFAGNKVEAMALAKVSGILFLAPLIGYIWHSPLLLPAGIVPPYWTPLAVARLGAGDPYGMLLAAGVLVAAAWLALFWRLFRQRRFP